jgi:hypothetical protein
LGAAEQLPLDDEAYGLLKAIIETFHDAVDIGRVRPNGLWLRYTSVHSVRLFFLEQVHILKVRRR